MNPSELPQFQDGQWFQQAMTHKSHSSEQGSPDHSPDHSPDQSPDQSNERLEFLGDAILTFLCGQFLYERYPHKPEGELTKLRASLVDRQQLSAFALALGLDAHLRLGKGVENSGGRQNPRLLSSAFEALIGAYFLNCDGNVDAVRRYVIPLFQQVLDQRGEAEPTVNYKSQLQEWALGQGKGNPDYRTVTATGPDHAKWFEVEVDIQGQPYGRGQGPRKQDAEKQAARTALEGLGLIEG